MCGSVLLGCVSKKSRSVKSSATIFWPHAEALQPGIVAALVRSPEERWQRGSGWRVPAARRAMPERGAWVGRPGEGCWLWGRGWAASVGPQLPHGKTYAEKLGRDAGADDRAVRASRGQCGGLAARRRGVGAGLFHQEQASDLPLNGGGLPGLQLVGLLALMRVRGCAWWMVGRHFESVVLPTRLGETSHSASFSMRCPSAEPSHESRRLPCGAFITGSVVH